MGSKMSCSHRQLLYCDRFKSFLLSGLVEHTLFSAVLTQKALASLEATLVRNSAVSIPERQKIQSQLVAQFLPILLAQCLYFNDLQQKVLHFNVLRQKVPYFKVSRQKVPYFKVSRVELNCFATKKGSFWLSLALSGSLSSSLWLSLTLPGSLWLSLTLSGSLWLTLARSL